jgi:hypothetical protein
MVSCVSSTSEMKVDVACLKRDFPGIFDFYSSWARLKKSEVENVRRHGHEFLQHAERPIFAST